MNDLEKKVTPDPLNPSSRDYCGVLKEAKNIFEWRFNLPKFFEAVTGNKPYPYQADFLEKMADLSNEYAIISAGRGCLEANTLIQMANGIFKKIKNIKPGDLVLSFNTKTKSLEKKRVIRVIPQGKDKVYRVKGSRLKGNEILVTSDHPIMDSFFTFKEARDYETNKWRVSKLKSLFIEEYDTRKEFLSDDIIRFLAFLIAEGYYASGASPKITNNNLNLLKKMESIARQQWDLNPKYYRKERGWDLLLTRDTKVGQSPLTKFLRKLGIYGQTGKNKEIPRIIFLSSNRQIRIFLKWFLLGDGNIDKRKNRIEVSLYPGLSKKLAQGLQMLLMRLGIYSKIYKRNRVGNDNYSVRFSQKHKFKSLIKESKNKYSFQSTRIKEIVGVREIYDLQVEGLSNFLAQGFIVHNTGKSESLAVLALWYIYILPLTIPGVPMKVVILAGSEKQARIVYNYITSYIAKIPFLQKALARDPTRDEILFIDGSWIRPLTASERSVRGPHPDLLIIDEACFLPGTRVIKNSDLPKIEEVKIGDKVLTSSGKFERVKRRLRRKYSGEIINIKLPGAWQTISLTPRHPVLALKRKYKDIRKQRKKMEKPSWLPASSLEKGDLVFQAIPKREIKLIPEIVIKTPKTKLILKVNKNLCRLIGYYLSEGSCNRDRVFFSFNSAEKDLQEEVKKLIDSVLGRKRAYFSECPKHTTNIVVSSRALVKFFRDEFGHSSSTKSLSERFWHLPLSYLDEIFKTLFLGDGYSQKRNGRSLMKRLHIKSRKLITQYYLYLTEKGKYPGIYKEKSRNIFEVYYSHASKRHKRFSFHNYLVSPIKSIWKNDYEGFVFNLEVENNPSYTLPSLTVHNCEAKDDLLKAAMPMIGTSKYPRLILSSTPDKYFSLFVDIYSKKKFYPQFLRWNWSAQDCPLVSKKFLKAQKGLIDQGSYQVEYLGLPYSYVGKVFPLKQLKECVKYRNLVETKGRKFAGVDWGHCFTGDHEVLTKRGWKRMDRLSGKEEILTGNLRTQKLEYQKITNYFKRKSKRVVTYLKNKNLSLAATWKHAIPMLDRTKNKFGLFRIGEHKTHHYLFRTLPFEGKKPTKILGFRTSDFLRLLGWYLAEGSVERFAKGYRISIAQERKKYRKEIVRLLKRMGLNPKSHPSMIRFSNKKLSQYFTSLGTSYHKFIPKEIKQLDSSLLKFLFETMMKGGGDSDSFRYNSFSSKLAEDFQEIVLKIGEKYAYISDRGNKGFRVNLHSLNSMPLSKHYSEQIYEGFFVGIEVPNEYVLIRHDTKPCLVHNYPAPTALVIVQEEIGPDKILKWKVLHTEPFLKQNFEKVLDKIELIVRNYQVTAIYTDSSDIGENQRLSARGLPVYPVKFKSQKAIMVSNLRALVENENIKIDGAKDYPLVAQMRDYRYDSKKNDDFVDCYSEDTEVLTKSGWKFFRDLNFEDEIATLTEEGFLEYQKPKKIISYDYNGKMFHVVSKMIDLLVTPNHRMYVSVSKGASKYYPFKLIRAKDIFNKHVRYKKDARWGGQKPDYFILPEVNESNNSHHHFKKRSIKIPIKVWLEFLGYYISEGNSYRNRVTIAQTKVKGRDQVFRCLQRLPFKWRILDDCFYTCNRQLFLYLKKLGRAYEKFLPKFLKELEPNLIKIFLRAYLLGDGHRNMASTSSKQLRDDLMELALKAGFSCNISLKGKKGTKGGIIEGRQLRYKHDHWLVSLITKMNHPRINHHLNKGAYNEMVDYSGKVYCVTVPNHILYVRRKGKGVWSGNSLMLAVKRGASLPSTKWNLKDYIIVKKKGKQRRSLLSDIRFQMDPRHMKPEDRERDVWSKIIQEKEKKKE